MHVCSALKKVGFSILSLANDSFFPVHTTFPFLKYCHELGEENEGLEYQSNAEICTLEVNKAFREKLWQQNPTYSEFEHRTTTLTQTQKKASPDQMVSFN